MTAVAGCRSSLALDYGIAQIATEDSVAPVCRQPFKGIAFARGISYA